MKILIAGGSGFLGSALRRGLENAGHEVSILTRQTARSGREIQWDGRTLGGWVQQIEGVDAVIQAAGYGLEHWPWTPSRKQRFIDSRVEPGRALAEGIQ